MAERRYYVLFNGALSAMFDYFRTEGSGGQDDPADQQAASAAGRQVRWAGPGGPALAVAQGPGAIVYPGSSPLQEQGRQH
eukprot:scaffold94346_cov42-Prasinocladus_malaysianus.AAC.2